MNSIPMASNVRRAIIVAGFAVVALCAASIASASVLTFTVAGLANGRPLPNDYGDRITSATMGSYSYGLIGGITPNVVAEYRGASLQPHVNWRYAGFNDLLGVIYNEFDLAPWYRVHLTADPGYLTTIESFDVGNRGGEITVPNITIYDGNFQILWEETDIIVPASTSPHISFAPNVTNTALIIQVTTVGLGHSSDNIALDNIQFTQQLIPAPGGALALLLLAGLGLMRPARRRMFC